MTDQTQHAALSTRHSALGAIRLAGITIAVTHLEAMTAFYQQVLGAVLEPVAFGGAILQRSGRQFHRTEPGLTLTNEPGSGMINERG